MTMGGTNPDNIIAGSENGVEILRRKGYLGLEIGGRQSRE